MRNARHRDRDATAGPGPDDGTALQHARRGEAVHVRNLDPERSYRLSLAVRDDDGVPLDETYVLAPGATRSDPGPLAPGVYDVVAELAAGDRDTARCAVGERPAHTVLVELGNGAVSVTEGRRP